MDFSRREALLAASTAFSANTAESGSAKQELNPSQKAYVLGSGEILYSTDAVLGALELGNSVVLGPGRWQHFKPFRLTFERQSLFCLPGATLIPLYDGNCIEVEEWFCEIAVAISGSAQPRTGMPGAAIVLGMHGRHAGHSSVTGSIVTDYFGNGYQWEQGAGVDFSRSLAKDCTGVGYLCTGRYNDNNHGQFRFSHATRCQVAGYKIEKHDPESGKLDNRDSRHHSFDGAKAFGCGTNFIIETQGNVGTVFSELGSRPDVLTKSSVGNKITWIGTETAYHSLVDLGKQNTIEGYVSSNRFSTSNLFLDSLIFGGADAGQLRWGQVGPRVFSNEISNTQGAAQILHRRGTALSRVDHFEGEVRFSGQRPLAISETASGVAAVPALKMLVGKRFDVLIRLQNFKAHDDATVLVTPRIFGGAGEVQLFGSPVEGNLCLSIIQTHGADLNLPATSVRWVVINHRG